MKQGTNNIMPVHFGIDLDGVSSIDFIFVQEEKKKYYTYPSDTAIRREGENVVELYWTEEDTYDFLTGEVQLDTKIHLTGSEQNPPTEIVKFKMTPTLFEHD